MTDRLTPTQVGTDSNWAYVDPGAEHTCATRTDHTLWCWGDNQHGSLGLGDKTRPKRAYPGRHRHRLGHRRTGVLPHLRDPG